MPNITICEIIHNLALDIDITSNACLTAGLTPESQFLFIKKYNFEPFLVHIAVLVWMKYK